MNSDVGLCTACKGSDVDSISIFGDTTFQLGDKEAFHMDCKQVLSEHGDFDAFHPCQRLLQTTPSPSSS